MSTDRKSLLTRMAHEYDGRHSFVRGKLEIFNVLKVLFPYGLTSFGTQMDQIDDFRQQFVVKNACLLILTTTYRLSQSQYHQIVNLCGSLPGSTSVQILIIVTTLLTKSPFGGFLSFLAFCLPSAILLFILAMFMKYFVSDQTLMPVQVRLLFLGFKSAAAGLMAYRLIQAVREYNYNIFKISIATITSLFYFYFRSTNAIEACLVFGAVFSLYVQTESKRKMNINTQAIMKNMQKHSILFGKLSVYLLFGIYLALWLFCKFNDQSRYIYCGVFYFAGCLIFGQSIIIFPLLYAYFMETNVMNPSQFWMGVPFAFVLPGTPVNICVYYGTLVDGYRGAILAWAFTYLPAFLSVYGILPTWYQYRDRAGVQRLLIGLNCVSNGFVLAAIMLILEHTIHRDVGIAVGIFLITLFFHSVLSVWAPAMVLIGGFLANTRRWGMVYYRFLPEPDF